MLISATDVQFEVPLSGMKIGPIQWGISVMGRGDMLLILADFHSCDMDNNLRKPNSNVLKTAFCWIRCGFQCRICVKYLICEQGLTIQISGNILASHKQGNTRSLKLYKKIVADRSKLKVLPLSTIGRRQQKWYVENLKYFRFGRDGQNDCITFTITEVTFLMGSLLLMTTGGGKERMTC